MFKIGDRVKVIKSSSSSNSIGDIGIITENNGSNEFRVSVKGKSQTGNWHYAKELQLVK